eukprot:925221-Rhodomonas_salina.1
MLDCKTHNSKANARHRDAYGPKAASKEIDSVTVDALAPTVAITVRLRPKPADVLATTAVSLTHAVDSEDVSPNDVPGVQDVSPKCDAETVTTVEDCDATFEGSSELSFAVSNVTTSVTDPSEADRRTLVTTTERKSSVPEAT